MARKRTPDNFKFEESKFKLCIEATGKEDGETISSHLEAAVHCEEDFALSVIDNLFNKDPEMEELFRKVIAERAMRSLLDDVDLEEMLSKLEKSIKN